MADYTLTAAQIKANPGSTVVDEVFGTTIAAGDVVYRDTAASNKLKLADANGASADIRTAYGIALNGGGDGQPAKVAIAGPVVLSTGAAVGAVGAGVMLSGTPGKLAPITDNTTGIYTNFLGFLDSTGKILNLAIHQSGVATP